MKPTTSNLIRLAGQSALLGGTCYVFVGVFHPPNVPASVSTTRWAVVHVVACAMCFLSLLGITGALPTIWTLTGPLYMLGGLLFGISIYRVGILPRWAGVLLAVGTVMAPIAALLPNASQPKIAIPVGVALAWLGYALWSERRPDLVEPDSQPQADAMPSAMN